MIDGHQPHRIFRNHEFAVDLERVTLIVLGGDDDEFGALVYMVADAEEFEVADTEDATKLLDAWIAYHTVAEPAVKS